MKYDNQLRYAVNITEDYKGEIPLAAWLKDFFRANKQMGSKDRKTVAELLYNYYRLGHSMKQVPVKEKMLAGLFLCNQLPNELLQYFKPQWNQVITSSLQEKISLMQQDSSLLENFSINDIFPWQDALTASINAELFNQSFLIQPDLFLRLRPAKETQVLQKLHEAGIPYQQLSPATICLPNATKLDEVIELDREAVIQDYNSQSVGQLLKLESSNLQPKITVWDSCAASGGKSIMVYDLNPSIQLTVSDLRPSIIENLHKRFEKAGIKSYTSFIADLTRGITDEDRRTQNTNAAYDLIIADLPCTGSGTWSRTPEQLYFFKKEKITYYSHIQKKIVDQLLPRLKQGGCLLYITCSVFRQENEEVVDYIKSRGAKMKKTELFKGYDIKADSLFAALFTS